MEGEFSAMNIFFRLNLFGSVSYDSKNESEFFTFYVMYGKVYSSYFLGLNTKIKQYGMCTLYSGRKKVG